MANSNTFTDDARVTVGNATKKTDIDKVAENTDYLKEALETIMDTSAADGALKSVTSFVLGGSSVNGSNVFEIINTSVNDIARIAYNGSNYLSLGFDRINQVGTDFLLQMGGTTYFALDTSGDIVLNNAAIATTATTGFLYVASCAGTPTGTPAGHSGRVPLVVDTTNNKLYFYSNSAWRDAGP